MITTILVNFYCKKKKQGVYKKKNIGKNTLFPVITFAKQKQQNLIFIQIFRYTIRQIGSIILAYIQEVSNEHSKT